MKEKTKILFCITKSNWGGAQKYVFNLATSISKRDFDVGVVCGGNGELVSKLKEVYVKVVPLSNLERNVSFLKDYSSLRELISIFKRENPVLVHLNSSKMGILGGLAVLYLNRTNKLKSIILRKNFRPIKVIFTAHGWAFNEDRPYWQKVILKVLHKKTISLSDTTIAVAEVVKNQVVDKNNYNKIVTIYNGVEKIKFLTKKLSRNEISMRANVTFDSRARWVGTISELHRNKGLIYAIEAIKNIKKTPAGQNIKFFIIGEGEERTYLEKMISDYNLKNDVFLLGHINNASQFLKAFDIFMLTSTTEALPYVLLEAGLAGLPVIATRVGGIPEIIDDEKDGLLSRPKDAREISAMLEYIISSKEKSKRLSNNIKEKIIRSFSIKECVGKTEELYRELIK